MTRLTRKNLLLTSGAVAATAIAGQRSPLAAPVATARRRWHPGSGLSRSEIDTLAEWCDLLVPGAREAEIGWFVNQQLAQTHENARLMLRYMTWPPPYDGFYRDGVAALDAASAAVFGEPFVVVSSNQRSELLGAILGGGVTWAGPPAGLFYFVTRADAVDVVYGTREGFAEIDFPYMALVEPRHRW